MTAHWRQSCALGTVLRPRHEADAARRRVSLVALVAVLLAFWVGSGYVWPSSANAGSDVISNGYYYNPAGVFAPRHSLNKVDVTNTGSSGGNTACENALNANGTWAQSYSYCAGPVSPWNYAYHLFCACQLRRGWNGPNTAAWMVGVQYW